MFVLTLHRLLAGGNRIAAAHRGTLQCVNQSSAICPPSSPLRSSGMLSKSAERMGVDRAYVSGLELGQRNPTIVTLWHISEALGVTLRSFFKEAKPRRGGRARI